MTTPLRIFQVATGNLGTEMVKRIGDRPDLELVGLHCYTTEKIGRDVGEIVGQPPIGVLATLLFPEGIAPAAIGEITAEIDATARALNVEVLGGHTEVAPGLSAPIVVMSGVGN